MAAEKEEKTTSSWLKEAQKGYIRMGILILLNKKPSHGYEIMKEIKSRTYRLQVFRYTCREDREAGPRRISESSR